MLVSIKNGLPICDAMWCGRWVSTFWWTCFLCLQGRRDTAVPWRWR